MSDAALLEQPVEQQETSAAPPLLNKYHYPEFADYPGERYLDSIVMQILPYSLWRTWHYAVDFQEPNSQCYVGTTRLAARVKPGVRKVELDFQEFMARGLMRKYAARLPIKSSGKLEAVIVKDFTPLYDLAHEYHQWILSDQYVPASRDQVDLLKGDPHLLAKVLRFDNYRRLIVNRKPGRKSQTQQVHLYYRCTRPGDEEGWQDPEQPVAASADAQDAGTPGQNANLYSNVSDKTDSPYRESRKEEDSLPTDSSSNPFDGVVGAAIGNQVSSEETESKPKTKEPNPTQEEKGGAARVEDAIEYDIEQLKRDPLAMVAALLEMRERGQLGGDPQPAPGRSQKPKKAQRPRRVPPLGLLRTMGQYAQELGDNPKYVQSDITRASKIYFAAAQIFSGFTNSWFREQLEAAYDAACKRGIKKRVPFFFTTLENRMQFRVEELAFVRSDEALYADGDISDFVSRLKRQYERSGSSLDYEQWIRQSWLIGGSLRRE